MKINGIEDNLDATFSPIEASPTGPDYIQSFGKLDYRKGDTIVLKHPGYLSESAHANIGVVAKEFFAPLGVKVIVLEEGMDIGILREVKEED